MKNSLGVCILSLLLLILFAGTAAAVEVSTPEELKTAVSTANGDTLITFDAEFPVTLSDVIVLENTNNANITIQGGRGDQIFELTQTASGKKHFNLNGNADFTIKNIEFIGLIDGSDLETDGSFKSGIDHTTLTAGGGLGGTVAGILTIENSIFRQIRGTVIETAANEYIFEKTSFLANSALYGAVIVTNKPLTILNSTIADNYGSGAAGYSGGAIYMPVGSKFVSENSVYYNNRYNSISGNSAGGGAISFNAWSNTGNISIIDSVFEKNYLDYAGSTAANNAGTTADGGALYFFYCHAAILISGTTFIENTAYDEGGAVIYVNCLNANNRIENSTFYGNVALGQQKNDGPTGGGAVEIYNCDSYPVTLEGNTFVKNVAEYGNVNFTTIIVGGNSGGGISLSNSSAVLINNVISGNTKTNNSGGSVTSNIYKQTLTTTVTVTDKGGNIIDKTITDIFGSNDPVPVEIGTKKAGDPKSDYYQIIKTIPLNPEGEAFDGGLSPLNAATTLNLDQNDKFRHETDTSSGAVELQYIKYDLETDGEWKTNEFDDIAGDPDAGGLINRAAEFKSSNYFYQLTFDDGSEISVTSRTPVHAIDSEKSFIWWADENGIEINVVDGTENVVLTPVWGYIVTFQDYDGTELKKEGVLPGDDAIAPANPTRTGYTFTGWDTVYTNVQSDLTVTAQYKINETQTTGSSGGNNRNERAADSGASADENQGFEIEEIIPELIKPVAVILLFIIAIACYFYVRSRRE